MARGGVPGVWGGAGRCVTAGTSSTVEERDSKWDDCWAVSVLQQVQPDAADQGRGDAALYHKYMIYQVLGSTAGPSLGR
jgi:hypothetical protein